MPSVQLFHESLQFDINVVICFASSLFWYVKARRSSTLVLLRIPLTIYLSIYLSLWFSLSLPLSLSLFPSGRTGHRSYPHRTAKCNFYWSAITSGSLSKGLWENIAYEFFLTSPAMPSLSWSSKLASRRLKFKVLNCQIIGEMRSQEFS